MSRDFPFDLTDSAIADLNDIYDYTKAELGDSQAEKYLREINETMLLLSKNQRLGKVRLDIRKSLRSFPVSSHIIFYRIVQKRLRVIRVLHANRDLPRYLND